VISSGADDLARIASARILVVEDEGIVARDLQASLRALGHAVCGTAASGEEAIEKARACEPDLVLMDIRLRGDMDGIDAARIIRQAREVPVVFLTAYADEATLQRAATVGPYGYVLKPFDEKELQVAVLMAMCKHAAFAELERAVQDRTAELLRTEARVRELQAEVRAREAERMAREHELRARSAEEALRARDEFLSVASHELRTPVAALQLQLEVLSELMASWGAPREPKLAEVAEGARKAVSRLADLVEAVLDVSRIMLGKLVLHREEMDLGEAVAEVVGRHEALAERAGCTLELTVAQPVRGRWDRVRMEQVVTNLLSNAIKFGDGKPIHVAVGASAGEATLTVRDHGPGIAPEDLARILRRFERGVSHQRYGGLGLGLYVAGQIAQEHGGAIEVSSQPGDGATFLVRLPLE
jgi:signal transduction histidine kinase